MSQQSERLVGHRTIDGGRAKRGRGGRAVPERRKFGLAVVAAAIIGAFTAVQARINGSLGKALDDGILAAAVSFSTGLVILVLLSMALPNGRRGFRRLRAGLRSRSIPGWMLFGGLAGALTVAGQGLTVATIGVALFTVGFVAGQTASGLVMDRLGFGPSGVVPVTLRRVLGALLAIAGVAVCLMGGSTAGVPAWMLLVPLCAGVGVSWQQGANGRLRMSVESPLTATLVNFIGGTTVLLVAAGIHIAIFGGPRVVPTEPWLYAGGAIGVLYIFISAIVVRYTGVLVLGLASVVGLLSTSLVLDAAWPAPAAPPLPVSAAAAAIALAGAVIATLRWRVRVRSAA